MRILPILTTATFLLFSANTLAGPTNPLSCYCEFEGVLADGMGYVDAPDCQISEETDFSHVRGARGTFTKTLTVVGGAGQACGTMQIRKLFKDGNTNRFSCTMWIERSTSSDHSACEEIMLGNRPVHDFWLSGRGMRACQRLLDDVAEEVFALPDCRAP